MILALQSSTSTTFIAVLTDEGSIIYREEWLSERRLARELLARLETGLRTLNLTWHDLHGLIVFQGPGSFTSLRIGITVMNTIAYSEAISICGTTGEAWLAQGVERLAAGDNDHIVLPEYGAPPRITQPKK